MFVLRSRVEFAVEPDLKVHGIESKPGESVLEAFRPAGLGLSYQFSEDAGNDEQPADAFKALELGQRVTWLDTDTSEKFIPQMLGYEDIGAVSFSKGCYPGQEIVARTRYLGKVKRRPIIIRTGEPLAIKSAEHIDLLREETWSKAVVIDSAQDDGGTILFVVAPAEPEIGVREFKYQDRTYRSATM
jgi:folate-binding protein YgfZ